MLRRSDEQRGERLSGEGRILGQVGLPLVEKFLTLVRKNACTSIVSTFSLQIQK